MRVHVLAPLVAVLVAGCATTYSVPKEHAGPTVNVADTVVRESPGVLRVFALSQVDGQNVYNAVGASANLSGARALTLDDSAVSRAVEARPLKVTLQAQHMAAAFAGFGLLAQGKWYGVHRGEVAFNPVPGHRYRVNGSMDPVEVAAWIEDADTGERVTNKISKKP